MSSLDDFLRDLDSKSKEELEVLIESFKLKSLEIDPRESDEFEKYFVETESIVKLGKIIAAALKLREKMYIALTGVYGSGKSVALRYLHSKLSKVFRGCLDELDCKGDYLFLTDSQGLLSKVSRSDYIIVVVELPVYSTWIMYREKSDWLVKIFPEPTCSELEDILRKRFEKVRLKSDEMEKICELGSVRVALLAQIYGSKAIGLDLVEVFHEIPLMKKEILLAIASFQGNSGIALEDLSEILKRKPATIRKHLEILENKGLVSRRKSGRQTKYLIPKETIKAAVTRWGVEKLEEYGITRI